MDTLPASLGGLWSYPQLIYQEHLEGAPMALRQFTVGAQQRLLCQPGCGRDQPSSLQGDRLGNSKFPPGLRFPRAR